MLVRKKGALRIGKVNNVENSFQLFDTRELTLNAPSNPLSELWEQPIEQTWLEAKGHENVIAEITLPVNDFWYNYALNHNAVQADMYSNCADLNGLDGFEQRQQWIYMGHRQYLIEVMGVDTFYNLIV